MVSERFSGGPSAVVRSSSLIPHETAAKSLATVGGIGGPETQAPTAMNNPRPASKGEIGWGMTDSMRKRYLSVLSPKALIDRKDASFWPEKNMPMGGAAAPHRCLQKRELAAGSSAVGYASRRRPQLAAGLSRTDGVCPAFSVERSCPPRGSVTVLGCRRSQLGRVAVHDIGGAFSPQVVATGRWKPTRG